MFLESQSHWHCLPACAAAAVFKGRASPGRSLRCLFEAPPRSPSVAVNRYEVTGPTRQFEMGGVCREELQRKDRPFSCPFPWRTWAWLKPLGGPVSCGLGMGQGSVPMTSSFDGEYRPLRP